MNAIASGGGIFKENGEPNCSYWPENGHQRCPHASDQGLFKYLETATWARSKVLASARWWERKKDDLHRGPEFIKGTFGFRGSGIHFYSIDGHRLTKNNVTFLCEVPWEKIFDKKDKEFIFVGETRLRKAFLERILKEQGKYQDKCARLTAETTQCQKHVTRLSSMLAHE